MDIHKAIGKLPRPKRGFVLPHRKYTGPYNPLNEQLDEFDQPHTGQETYNAVDDISMRHDICYGDNGDTKEGKHACDGEMLRELVVLKSKGIREKIDKKLVRTIIGRKRKLGWRINNNNNDNNNNNNNNNNNDNNNNNNNIEWNDELADELHKPIRRKFTKRRVFANEVDSIWAADLVDMQSFSRSNKGYKYIMMIIDVFSMYG